MTYKSADHQPVYSEKLGHGEAKPRTITCTCGEFKTVPGYDNKIKPLFAQHRRDERAKG